jgi:transcriptional regulator with GAF, ATPase, and Fis domain
VWFRHGNGLGEYIVSRDEMPPALLPDGNDVRETELEVLRAGGEGPVQWLLQYEGAQRIVATQIPGVERPAFMWLAVSDAMPLGSDRVARLRALAEDAPGIFAIPHSADVALDQLRRLDVATELLPDLLHVLDVRQVFDRLSTVAKEALPHDLLLLRMISEDLSTVTIFASSDRTTTLGPAVPNPYPAYVTNAWRFDIVDDLTANPYEIGKPPAILGGRGCLRLPIRFDNQIIGGLGFVSFRPNQFTVDDVAIATRLADSVAVALSHQRMADRLEKEARRTEALRARASTLEMLDTLLAALIDSGDLREMFGRISEVVQKVLPHDAAALLVRLPDGRHARIHANTGFPVPLPEQTEIPEELLRNPDWEHDIFDDLTERSEPRYVRIANMGFRSLLRVPLRLDNQFAGALVFVANKVAAFGHPDVLVIRRIADRMAVSLAREREMEAAKRAAKADARATHLEARVRALSEELDARTGYRRVLGESTEWRQVLTQATQVAATDTTVLLLGESGTGKEVVARFLHRASTRKKGPFVALNCAALPEQLLEAELFGYERGAYTGAMQSKPGQLELAAGGTMFLDEVGELTPSAQAKILRVLQEREFQRLGGTRVLRTDARIVTATNRDLQRAITNGQFREDLYYRLNVFAIRLPSLRQRRDDILILSEAFLSEIGRGLGRPPGGISLEARRLLMDYHWPGNVRELRNILERAAILCDGGLIAAEHLAFAPIAAPAPSTPASPATAALSTPVPVAVPSEPSAPSAPGTDLNSMERAMIETALERARFNKSKAAKALGLTRHQLYIRMRKHGFH